MRRGGPSRLLGRQPAGPVLRRVVRVAVAALHAQQVELRRGAGVAVVAQDLHAPRKEEKRPISTKRLLDDTRRLRKGCHQGAKREVF